MKKTIDNESKEILRNATEQIIRMTVRLESHAKRIEGAAR